MGGGVEETAVVAGDGALVVEFRIHAVDKAEEPKEWGVEIGVVRGGEVAGAVAESLEATGEGKVFAIPFVGAVTVGADGKQVAALGVEDEEQPIEEDEAGVVERRPIGLGDGVGRVIAEAVGEVFEDAEDAFAEVKFEGSLAFERFLADVVERAAAIGLALEGDRAEERDEETEIVDRAELLVAGQFEGEVGVGGGTVGVEPPLVTVGQDGPVEKPGARIVFGVMEVILDLLRWKPAGSFGLGNFLEGGVNFLRFKHGGSEAERGGGRAGFCGRFHGRFVAAETIIGTLAEAALTGRQILLGHEVPAEFLEERIEELGAGVGFLGFGHAEPVFEPAGHDRLVERSNFVGGRKVGGRGEKLAKIDAGKKSATLDVHGLLMTTQPEAELAVRESGFCGGHLGWG